MSFSSKVKEELLENLSNVNKKRSLNKEQKVRYLETEKFGEYLSFAKYKNELEQEFALYFDISNLDEIDIKNILKGVFLN